MKGLILRWLYNLKRPFIIFVPVIMLLFILTINFVNIQGRETVKIDFDGCITILFIEIIIVVFSGILVLFSDRQNRFEKYILITPVSRKKYILSAYLFCGIIVLVSTFAAVIITLITMIIKNSLDIANLFVSFTTIFCISFLCVILIIMIELCLSRIANIIVCICAITVIILFSVFSNQNDINDIMLWLSELFENTNPSILILCELAVTAALSSIIGFASIALYKRREL